MCDIVRHLTRFQNLLHITTYLSPTYRIVSIWIDGWNGAIYFPRECRPLAKTVSVDLGRPIGVSEFKRFQQTTQSKQEGPSCWKRNKMTCGWAEMRSSATCLFACAFHHVFIRAHTQRTLHSGISYRTHVRLISDWCSIDVGLFFDLFSIVRRLMQIKWNQSGPCESMQP